MFFVYSLEGLLLVIISYANFFFLIAYGNRDIKSVLFVLGISCTVLYASLISTFNGFIW